MTQAKKEIVYGAAAQEFEVALPGGSTITMWHCKECGRTYDQGGGEGLASYCCCTTRRCQEDGCENLTGSKHYLACEGCRAKKKTEAYFAMPEGDWDGEQMIYDDGNYYATLEDWFEDVASYESAIENGRPVLCDKVDKPHFSMGEHCCDYFGPEFDSSADVDTIDDIVNKWAAENLEQMWIDGDTRLRITADMKEEIEGDV